MNNSKINRKTLSKRILCLLAIGLVCSFAMSVYASGTKLNTFMEQQQAKVTIQGKVIDSKGEPLIGVSVTVKGTTNGTLTDMDGGYSISTTANATLTFTYVGYKPQSIVVGNQKTINVTMIEDAQMMSEVVVVGFGVQKKENLTGAVASVDVGKTLDSRPISDVGRGLQGAVSGLSVVIPNGEVGSDPVMKIRGQIGSIQGNANPLILLDNVEIPSIQMVNPDDIESISVLKDAASSSIYGAKAAFGVILITTKKGAKSEKITVQYSNNFSWAKTATDIDMANIDGLEYSLLAAERNGSSQTGAFFLLDRSSFERSKKWLDTYGMMGANEPVVFGRDWYMSGSSKMGVRMYNAYDYLIKEWAPTQTHNLSVSGTTGKTTFNVSLGYFDQDGMNKAAKEDNFKRYNATARVSTQINKYVTARAGILFSQRTKSYPFVSTSTTADAWYYMYRWGSLQPYGSDEEGRIIRSPAQEFAQANTATQQYNYANVNIGATFNITKDWTVDADYTFSNNEYLWDRPGMRYTALNSWAGAIDKLDANGNQYYVNDAGEVVPAGTPDAMLAKQMVYQTYTAKGSASNDLIYRRSENTQQGTSNVYTTYNLKIANDHAFKAMVGLNWVKWKKKYNWSQKTELLDFENPQFDLASGVMTSGGGTEWESQLGYFGRINYMFKDKYLLEANLRYDGSSKFPKNLKWRWFPSFSAGWVASNEDFMRSLDPVLSFMKLRASWGSVGDQSVPSNLYVSTLSYAQTTWLDGSTKFPRFSTPAAVDANISWQNIETLDFGADLRFWKDKVGVTFDWYQRYTRDMITPGVSLPATFGASVPVGNYGELRTRGWELTVDFNHRFANGVGINLMGTISDATSFITDYPEGAFKDITNTWTYYKGKRYGDIWGYKTDRLYQMSDFELGADGKPQLIVLTAADTDNPKYIGKKAYKLKGDKPVYQVFLQNSSNFQFGPGDVKFVDLNGDGDINNGSGSEDDPGDLTVIGNSTPRYNYGFRIGADYKGFDVSFFFQGVGKREIWGGGALAIPGFNTGDGAMPQTFAGDFWTEERTNAFYPRPYNQANANNTNNMQVQDRYLLDMSYLRLKNVTLGYSFPANVIKKAYLTNARIYMSLENIKTWDNLRGLPLDPEVVTGYSMWDTVNSNYNSGRTGVGAPLFKNVSFGVQLTF